MWIYAREVITPRAVVVASQEGATDFRFRRGAHSDRRMGNGIVGSPPELNVAKPLRARLLYLGVPRAEEGIVRIVSVAGPHHLFALCASVLSALERVRRVCMPVGVPVAAVCH